MHYYKSNNEIMQYCIVSNDIALIMHYRALLKRSNLHQCIDFEKSNGYITIFRGHKTFYFSKSHNIGTNQMEKYLSR